VGFRKQLLACAVFLLSACSEKADDGRPTGSGGAGGSAAGGTGGVGAAGTGGFPVGGTGGVGAMGTDSGASGASGVGGNGGSAGLGGTAGQGGTAGGAGTAGQGGTAGNAGAAGTTGSGGSAGTSGPSPGCGVNTWPPSGPYSIDVNGTRRDYVVTVPSSYASQQRYRLIFAWHGAGGTAQQTASSRYFGLESRAAGNAIFVAGQGLPQSGQGAANWANTGGRDIAFARALVGSLRGTYCVDDDRIFSVGVSAGGFMSNLVGCALGDVFRAIAPIAGAGPVPWLSASSCRGQVAAWITHGNQDTIVQFSMGTDSRDYWRTANHCGTQGTTNATTGCIAYEGCDPGHPVHWCEHTGGHTVPSFASEAIWSFFEQL
jgi:polyhydroxybutyrate depolymerase